jgi:hypothetical protein
MKFLKFFLICSLFSSRLDAQNTKDWKLGVALYTFHSFSFPEAIAKVDSAHIHYIEGFTFQKAGGFLKDSLIMNLSPTV